MKRYQNEVFRTSAVETVISGTNTRTVNEGGHESCRAMNVF